MVAIAVSLAGAEATPFAAAMRSALRKVLAAAPAAQMAEAAQLMERVRLIGTAGPGRSGPGQGGGPQPPANARQNGSGGAVPGAQAAAERGRGPPGPAGPLAVPAGLGPAPALPRSCRGRPAVRVHPSGEPAAIAV